jgi:hypothetical protein
VPGLLCDGGRSRRIVHSEKDTPRSVTNDDIGVSREFDEYCRARLSWSDKMRQEISLVATIHSLGRVHG